MSMGSTCRILGILGVVTLAVLLLAPIKAMAWVIYGGPGHIYRPNPPSKFSYSPQVLTAPGGRGGFTLPGGGSDTPNKFAKTPLMHTTNGGGGGAPPITSGSNGGGVTVVYQQNGGYAGHGGAHYVLTSTTQTSQSTQQLSQNNQPPTPKVTTTTQTSTSTTSYTTSYAYTVFSGAQQYLTWLLKTPQGKCHAGLCLLGKSMGINKVTGNYGSPNNLANAVFIQSYNSTFIYPDFGVQPAIVIVEKYTTYNVIRTYTTTTITRTVTQTITQTITNILQGVFSSTGGARGTGGNLNINTYFISYNGGGNIINPGGSSNPGTVTLQVGDTFIYDTLKAADFAGAAATKALSDVTGSLGNLFNGAGNWLNQNGLSWLGNLFTTIGNNLNSISNQLLTTSLQLTQQGEATNTAWQVSGNANVNGINAIWYPTPSPTPGFTQGPTPTYGGTNIYLGQPPSAPYVPSSYYASSIIYLPGTYTSTPPIIQYPG